MRNLGNTSSLLRLVFDTAAVRLLARAHSSCCDNTELSPLFKHVTDHAMEGNTASSEFCFIQRLNLFWVDYENGSPRGHSAHF
jgi:hypothetical protein